MCHGVCVYGWVCVGTCGATSLARGDGLSLATAGYFASFSIIARYPHADSHAQIYTHIYTDADSDTHTDAITETNTQASSASLTSKNTCKWQLRALSLTCSLSLSLSLCSPKTLSCSENVTEFAPCLDTPPPPTCHSTYTGTSLATGVGPRHKTHTWCEHGMAVTTRAVTSMPQSSTTLQPLFPPTCPPPPGSLPHM